MRSSGPQVKNRAPAPIQITAEQLLREVIDITTTNITMILITIIIIIRQKNEVLKRQRNLHVNMLQIKKNYFNINLINVKILRIK